MADTFSLIDFSRTMLDRWQRAFVYAVGPAKSFAHTALSAKREERAQIFASGLYPTIPASMNLCIDILVDCFV